jgi:hypothetical protein
MRMKNELRATMTRSVSFPKVNLATQLSMKPVLTRLGMGVSAIRTDLAWRC